MKHARRRSAPWRICAWSVLGIFQVMGVALQEGRTFDPADRAGGDSHSPQRVVVISQGLAQALWPQQDRVVGRKIVVDGPGVGDYRCG